MPTRPKMLLVVDNDPNWLFIATHYLERYHVVLKTCVDPEAGLEMLKRDYFDYAFIDQRMPRISGLEFISKAKGHSRNSGITYYLLTEFRDMRVLRDATRAGIVYVPKDFFETTVIPTLFEPRYKR